MIQLFAEVARAINWFNPLFWLACARLRRESEYACDDIVLDLGIGGTSYASHLIDLARTFSVHGRTWLPAPSIARPSTLERRVRAMLNPQLNRRPVSMMRRAALAIVLLALALPIAAASQAIEHAARHRHGSDGPAAGRRDVAAHGDQQRAGVRNQERRQRRVSVRRRSCRRIHDFGEISTGFSGSRQRMQLVRRRG